MKQLLAATCAAAMLTASLTGCGMTNNKGTQNSTGTGTDRPSYSTSTGANNGTGNTGTNSSTGNTGANSGAGTQNGGNSGTTDANNAIDGTGNALTNNGVNGSTNTYADGAAQDRAGYDRMLSSRTRYGMATDGKYTAYSDGEVSDRGSTGSLIQDGKNVGRNLVDGTRNMVQDMTQAVRDMGGVPRADDMPRK